MSDITYGICIPTWGKSYDRIPKLIESIKRFTKGLNYSILVSDDATKDNSLWKKLQKNVESCDTKFMRLEKHGYLYNNFQALGDAVCDIHDVIVYICDDCLVSHGWLNVVDYFYRNNPNLNLGIVSNVFLEAWELTMNDMCVSEDSFFSIGDHFDGYILREHLTYTWDKYIESYKNKKIHNDLISVRDLIRSTCGDNNVGVMGCDEQGRYTFTKPKAQIGGVGPCFTIRSDVFKEVGGFSKCEFAGDYEILIGCKTWDAGYTNVLLPSPPVYHGKGYATRSRDAQMSNIEHQKYNKYRCWTDESIRRFKEKWTNFETFEDLHMYYNQTYVKNNNTRVKESSFIPYDKENGRFKLDMCNYEY